MKKPKYYKATTAYRMRHLGQPHALRHVGHHKVNVEAQRKFLAAQDKQQHFIEQMRLGPLRGNPYIK